MRLSRDRNAYSHLNGFFLKLAILERRNAIRKHRDAVGDDRCWLDDYGVWYMVAEAPCVPVYPPAFEEAMRLCRQFYDLRRVKTLDPVPPDAILDYSLWDDDLACMTKDRLLDALEQIQNVIWRHYDIGERLRTIEDDRVLYAVLPEKIPGDLRLPLEDEFLGQSRAPHAGCPAFWRSHDTCPVRCHNLHAWGPCE
ncbi:MAG: hypothetical protein U1A23_03695 [Candidatus Sungbacteria bacterium]|nr:hypothetical protein [bacterium]MDZ4286005.1 hypothetical protein [Candidatus Sungbacteria bacterium]